ncbi:MAG: GNAT family N-acetyltransferase, partial [Actinobacteria bacterium]|nr:GNAT family N-acetyltransferase [Actinomycetota bacterium]
MNAHAQTLYGESELTADEVRHWFTVPHMAFRVAEHHGALVGYADVRDEQGEGRWFDLDVRTIDRAAAAALVASAEAWATGRGTSDAAVRGYAPSLDEALRTTYENAGYRVIRHSFQMRIDLEDDLSEPRWPAGIAVRTFEPGEEERVHAAAEDAFADHWDHRPEPFDAWRRYHVARYDFDPSLWFLAEDGAEVAGIALCLWHFSGDPAFGWVNVLGVRRPWRRRGLGSALLAHAFREFARRGATRVGLGVDAENTTGA